MFWNVIASYIANIYKSSACILLYAYIHYVASCNMGKSDIYTPEAQGPQVWGLRVYISGKLWVPMLQLLCNLSYRSQTYVCNKNGKPPSIITPYSLGYKYNCERIYGRVKLPTKTFTKNGSGVLHTMKLTNVDYWNMKGMICIP